MKQLLIILTTTAMVAVMYGQSPEKMSYQAVVHNNNNQLVTNKEVGMQISILHGSVTGTAVYIETQTPTSNTNGLVTIEIGGGTVISGTFSTIDWADGSYFIKTETDPEGGSSYTIAGVSQLISVPYALYAKTSGNSFSEDYNDLDNKPDFTNWDKDSTDNVLLTGNQTIDGTIIFTGAVNVNAPINSTDAVNKAYVDLLLSRIEALESHLNLVPDIDGNIYSTVTIGTQVWFAENLKASKYSNGELIPNVSEDSSWSGIIYGARCYYNNDSATYNNTYGALYNFYSVVDSRNLCPTGWHVPRNDEWTTLTDYLTNNGYGYGGSGSDIAKSLAATSGWRTAGAVSTVGNDQASNNSSGFTALPGGGRVEAGIFYDVGYDGYWWSSTEYSTADAYRRYMGYGNNFVLKDIYDKRRGFSVRCLRD